MAQHTFGDRVLASRLTTPSSMETWNTISTSTRSSGLFRMSNTANLVAFYDKNGLEARLALNWRKSLPQQKRDPGLLRSTTSWI